MFVGVLFRGPLRPSVSNVLKNRDNLLSQLSKYNIKYETWLSTWNTHLGKRVIDELPPNSFDNVIALNEPDDSLPPQWWGMHNTPSSQPVYKIWRAMLSSRVALQAMIETNKYEWIIHARTDGVYDFNGKLATWFNKDSIGTKHIDPFINDMLNIGPAKMVADVYDYGNVDILGQVIHHVFCPEQILMEIAKFKNINWHVAEFEKIWMDDNRKDGEK